MRLCGVLGATLKDWQLFGNTSFTQTDYLALYLIRGPVTLADQVPAHGKTSGLIEPCIDGNQSGLPVG